MTQAKIQVTKELYKILQEEYGDQIRLVSLIDTDNQELFKEDPLWLGIQASIKQLYRTQSIIEGNIILENTKQTT